VLFVVQEVSKLRYPPNISREFHIVGVSSQHLRGKSLRWTNFMIEPL